MALVYKGWNAKIYLDDLELGCCESASVEIASNIEPYYCVGARDAQALVEGNQEITGSISRAWVNTYYLALVASTGALSEFTLVFKASEASGAPWIYCYNCKFETGSVDIPQDGFLMEDYDFRARSIGFTTGP